METDRTAPDVQGLPASLLTPRLILRQPADADIADLVRGIGNFNVSRWLGQVPYPYGPRQARIWLAVQRYRHRQGRDLSFVIAQRTRPHTVIGGIGCHEIYTKNPSIGYWLAERHWGKGYGQEALGRLLLTLFEIAPEAVPVATTLPDNQASIALLDRAGFRRVPGRFYTYVRSRQRKLPVLRFIYAGAPHTRAQDPARASMS